MPDAPPAVLRQAAARVRETGAACEPHVISLREVPWHVEANLWGQRTTVVQGGQYPADEVQQVRRIADTTTPELAAWIALMHTGLAEPLAKLLESFAATAYDPEADIQVTDVSHERVLAVARIILGTPKETIA